MLRVSLTLLMLLCFLLLKSQTINGTITYDRFYDYIAINDKLSWKTEKDKDRSKFVRGNTTDKYGVEHKLEIANNCSYYYRPESEVNYGYSWVSKKYQLYHDLNENRITDLITFMDKNYLVEGEIPIYNWKILTEIREIEGYLCMKAETRHPIHDGRVYAWFTDQIPFYGGPEGYSGLPGLILGLEVDDVVEIIATNIDLEQTPEIQPPSKKRTKKLSYSAYIEKVKEFLNKSIKRERNPYWDVRY